MADPSKDLWDAASQTMVLLLSRSRLSRLETTVPRLEDGLAGPRVPGSPGSPGSPPSSLARYAKLRAAANALTRACQAGDDLSVGVLPPDACAR
jgi:hypothetical protein